MSKFSILIAAAAAASAAGLSSCFPPEPPPTRRYRENPSYPQQPPSPYDSAQPDFNQPLPPAQPPLPTQPPPPPPTATGGYPTATRTANPDQVLSPYEPFNVIDVAGFASGKLVRDPSNQKIFRVP